MNITVVFKGGSMDGTEIIYEVCGTPSEGDVIFVKGNCSCNNSISFWVDNTCQVYTYVQKLHSWVYDHECEVVNEK